MKKNKNAARSLARSDGATPKLFSSETFSKILLFVNALRPEFYVTLFWLLAWLSRQSAGGQR